MVVAGLVVRAPGDPETLVRSPSTSRSQAQADRRRLSPPES